MLASAQPAAGYVLTAPPSSPGAPEAAGEPVVCAARKPDCDRDCEQHHIDIHVLHVLLDRGMIAVVLVAQMIQAVSAAEQLHMCPEPDNGVLRPTCTAVSVASAARRCLSCAA
jgi:hypothetical protein